MPNDSHSRNVHATIARVVAVGMLGLAAAMGIGRFAFTPLLPLMQPRAYAARAGGWLAAANYPGYLAGALACMWLRRGPKRAATRGCSWPGAATRAWDGAPIARAVVVVALRCRHRQRDGAGRRVAWGLAQLAQRRAGWPPAACIAGVGIGMALAGGQGSSAALSQQAAGLGVARARRSAALAAAVVWRPLAATSGAARADGAAARTRRRRRRLAAPVFAYGVVGFGYIMPATFLPAVAREQFADRALFGWSWPLSAPRPRCRRIVAVALVRHGIDPRRIWTGCQLVMALGVVAPAVCARLRPCCFRRVRRRHLHGDDDGGDAGGAFGRAGCRPRLMAAMTAAFAAGQWLGPLTVSVRRVGRRPAAGAESGSPRLLVLGAGAVHVRRRRMRHTALRRSTSP